MRTYVTLAALAVTAAACGAADRTTLPAVVPVQPAAAVEAHAQAGFAAASFGGFAGYDGAGADARDREAGGSLAPAASVDPEETVVPPVPQVERTRTPRVAAGGKYRTPDAAMRALVRAYNGHDDATLRKVTTPGARRDLVQMRTFAPRMRLVGCHDSGFGSYHCTFSHTMKGSTKSGTATVQVSPAAKPGWYASMLVDCG